MKKIITLSFLSLLVPNISFAALQGLKSLIVEFQGLLKLVYPIVVALAFIFFFWGVARFILNAGDDKKRADGQKKMMWGIIALFVVLSIMGILYFIGGAIGIGVNGGIPGMYNTPNPNSIPISNTTNPAIFQGGFNPFNSPPPSGTCPANYCDDNNGGCYPC